MSRDSSLPLSMALLSLSSSTTNIFPERLLKKMETVKKFAKKVKVLRGRKQLQRYEWLPRDWCEGQFPPATTPAGFFGVYVGEERQRFAVPLGFLSHPLFKMFMEKSYKEYGYEQRRGLVVPCAVSVFQEVLSAVECSHGQFDIEKFVDELI